MAGFFGDTFDDPQSAAIMALAAGMLRGDMGGGFLGANEAFAQSKRAQALAQRDARDAELHGLNLRKTRMELDAADRQMALEKRLDDAARQNVISPDKAAAMSAGPMPDGSTVRQVSPGFDTQGYVRDLWGISPRTAIDMEQRLAKDDTPIVLAPGATALDRRTRQPIFTAPKEDTPTELAKLIKERDKYAPGTAGYQLYDRMIGKQTTHQPAPKVEVNMGQKGLENELKVRDDWRSEPIYKAHQEVQSAHAQITQALAQASPAGDLAGATKLMKILDPGSVVRESELGMAMAASGLLDRVENYAKNIINGTKLTPTQRADFQKLADALASESTSAFNAKHSEYADFATQWGLNADRILGKKATTGASATTPKSEPKTFDKLPPAHQYKGRTATNIDPVTGVAQKVRSNGLTWEPVQ